ncbi:MAG: C45 family autoproteolytic acyltransferase/hydrolase [Bacteroidota bacterium]|nr:C45 family autoproteolytic acyltransferase/hydrolase [Bacteroidota bacterium]
MKIIVLVLSLMMGLFINVSGQNSKIFSEFVGDGDDRIEVIVVSGTPHQMGVELGKHLKDKAKKSMQMYLNAAQKEDSTLCSRKNLLLAWKTNEPYMDKRFIEELKGFSEGSGIDLSFLEAAHAIPFISPYACSGVDAWGKATTNGHLYQIRNLDYSTDAGLQDYPVVIVYKPTNGIAHANITFSGMLSSHTGINAQSIVIGEKGESPERELPYDLHGKHFTILFRELLYDAKSLSDAEKIIENSKLIKRYYFFVGDGKLKDGAALKYLISTPDSVRWHKWTDMDKTDIHVPKVYNDITYYTMKNDIASTFFDEHYGRIGAPEMIKLSKSVASGGNLADVVYDATALEIWVANATDTEPASARQYVHIDLKKYFK